MEDADAEYQDGGGDNDWLIYWQSGVAAGKTDQEIVERWILDHPERAEEAVVEKGWRDG